MGRTHGKKTLTYIQCPGRIPERRISLKITRCILADNIKTFLQWIRLEVTNWINLAQNTSMVGSCEKGNEP